MWWHVHKITSAHDAARHCLAAYATQRAAEARQRNIMKSAGVWNWKYIVVRDATNPERCKG